jgi:hypothetical protein
MHEKAFNVKLENETVFRIIPRTLPYKTAYTLNAEMRSFTGAAGVTVVDE